MKIKLLKDKKLTKGFVCQCGQEHLFPVYVFAHWDDLLVFKCPECSRSYEIVSGTVSAESKE